MTLKDLFKQQIDRNIETVIKADDQEHILQEMEEYVITREIAKKITPFFSAYNDYQGANGAWISGFFGSGKSHLLKILSYVLENKEYNGFRLGERFAAKIEDDPLLKGDVEKAIRIPSESILFNIDQQAQITTKQDQDAILNVFYKVFYDHLGYFGAQRHVAEFERWLDQEGIYNEFMDGFEAEAGEHWNGARRKYFDPRVKKATAAVLGRLRGESPDNYLDILDTLRRDNQASIEDFCEKVLAYISSKPKGFRLNFFVDEVGQFISDNTKLMLNLQTIAETLATKTKGQSWLLVTSQEDMERVVGNLNARQQNDFSRIQARFRHKVPLTSANVDEVIEKRLLDKAENGTQLLKTTWKKESANLETLLSFSEAGVQFKKFRDEQDFARKFPFVPYEFDLFQQCIRALSEHNAFQGKHASVGERSMLGVFQEVLKRMKEEGPTRLVSFDLLFEGLRSTIRGEIQNAITLAERNLASDFAIRVLKALFLVKYYSNFKTTLRNVSVLMIDDLHIDLKAHEKRVQEALNLLEAQTYIQRNGDLYEFLTDEEKDIETEVKNTGIDPQQVHQLLSELLFDEVIKDNRIRFVDNRQEYEFTRKIDGAILSRDRELVVEIITPNSDFYGKEDYYKAQTMGMNILLLLVLPNDDRLVNDLRMYLKTDKYIKQAQSTANNEIVKRILFEKAQQNQERRRSLLTLLRKLLGEAHVYLNGSLHDRTAVSDGRNKVHSAFQDLIKLAYPNLRMLGANVFDEETVKSTMRNRQDDLFGGDDNTMSEAEAEILQVIQRRKKQSDRTTLADLRDHFAKRPYGWYPNAVWTMTARLFKRGKIEPRQESNPLNDQDFLAALLNNRLHGNTLLDPQPEFDQIKVRKLKEVYAEAFDEPCPGDEAREIANAFREKVRSELQLVKQRLSDKNQYPFLEALEPVQKQLQALAEKEYTYLITNVQDFENPLLDAKEDLLDPIRRFWNGEQKQIFDRIRLFLEADRSNFDYIEGEELQTIRDIFKSPKPYAGSLMRDAKIAMESLGQKMHEKLAEERKSALLTVQAVVRQIEQKEEFAKLSEAQQTQVLQPFDELTTQLDKQRYIANIRQSAAMAKGELLEKQLNLMLKLAQPREETPAGQPEPPRTQYVRWQNVKPHFDRNELRSEEDVQAYLRALEEELLRHIHANRRISL
jgi:hypothetical protein